LLFSLTPRSQERCIKKQSIAVFTTIMMHNNKCKNRWF